MKEIRLKTIEYLEKVVPNFKKTRGKNINFTCPQCLSDEPTCHLISPTVPVLMCTKCASQGKGRLGYVDEYYAKVRNCTPDEVLQDIVKVLSLTTPAPKTLKEFLDFYEQMKFDLVPVSRNSKAPIEMAWTTKTHTDRKEWEKWLENKLNIGVKAGECSNVTVIDIDTAEIPEEIDKLKGEEVLIQKSRQGWHLFYQYEPELVTTRIDEMKIDILNNGKQCILYPSEIDGYFRQFVTDLKPIPKMPSALKDYIKEKTGKNPVTKTFSEILKEDIQTENFHSDVIQEGNRNNFMIRLGGILKKELNLGQVCYTLDIINRHFCKPSLDPREFRNLVNQIDKYVSNDLNDTTSKVLAYLKLVGEATGRDIQEVLGEKKEIVDKVLAHLMREGLVLRKNRMYIAVKRADWKNEFPTLSPEVPFKVPYFNDVAHFNYGDMILLGGRSKVGKCISEGLVYTNQGLRDIADIGKNHPDGTSTLTKHIRVYSGDWKRKTFTHPNYFYKEKVNNTIKITTHHGYELEGTPDHPILVVKQGTNNMSETEWKKLRDITEKDEAVLVTPKNKQSKRIKKQYIPIFKVSKHATNLKHTDFDMRITPEMSKLFGYITGDGHVYHSNVRIYQNSKDTPIHDEIRHLCKKIGLPLKETISKNGNMITFIISSVKFSFFVRRKLFEIRNNKIFNIGSRFRFFPRCILSANEEVQIGFIEGLFNCESWINKQKGISVGLTNPKLIKQLHVILLKFGVISRLRLRIGYKGHETGRLTIPAYFVQKFLKTFNLAKYKNHLFQENNKLPYNLKEVGKNQFKEEASFYLDKIKKIEYKNEEKYVYDFNLSSDKYKKANRFWVNGFVSHNTTQAMNIIKRFVAQGVKPHYMYLETGCFDEETELLTNNGWKNLDSILETDKVLSLNPMEGFSVYKPITHIFKENYKGKMLSYKNDAVDFKITPNHKIYYRSEYEDFYELDEIREVIKHNKSIRFKTNFKLRDNHFRVSEIKIGEKYFNRTALMKFLGWFISEGNLTGTDIPEHSKKRKVWKIQITQRKETYKKELLAMFSELGFTPKISRGEVYYIDSKELYVWLRTYCYHPELKRMRRSYIKYIPEIVMEATPDDIRVFLDSYIMGDGHFSIRKDGTRINHISTAQKHLADSLQLLMLKLGKSASLKFYKNSTLGCYRVTEIIENEVQVKKDKITEENYDGRIWCVETKPYHLVFARRNGYCYWSGNSRFLKTALTLGLKEGDFYHAFVSDPTKVELEKNAVTILDWLLIDNYAETDKVLKYFVEQLNKTNGFLIIFMQLKEGDNWFAPNMIHFFPALAARYIYDKVETGYGTTGAWVIDAVRDPKNHSKGGNLPCTYDWVNKTLKLNGEIDEKEERKDEDRPF